MHSPILRSFAAACAAAVSIALLAGFTPADAGMPTPMIVAHRGASDAAPENTLAAYRLAWAMGSHAAETDVWLTADGKVVCLHDRSLERTTGLDANIDEVPWEVVSQLDAGSWKGPEWAGEPVPLLANVLRTIPPGRLFFLEVKSGPETVPAILEVVEESGKAPQIILIAFEKAVLERAQEIMPDLPKLWLIGSRRQDDGSYEPVPAHRLQEAFDAGFQGLNISWRGVSDELLAACEAAGTPLSVWTVNSVPAARRLVARGVQTITTDVPDEMLAEFHPAP